jgi:hypothetical protein
MVILGGQIIVVWHIPKSSHRMLDGQQTPTVLEPRCTRTVPKPYVIAVSGVTSSEKQIPRNC